MWAEEFTGGLVVGFGGGDLVLEATDLATPAVLADLDQPLARVLAPGNTLEAGGVLAAADGARLARGVHLLGGRADQQVGPAAVEGVAVDVADVQEEVGHPHDDAAKRHRVSGVGAGDPADAVAAGAATGRPDLPMTFDQRERLGVDNGLPA